MKKIRFLFLIAFIFYFVGHILWSYSIIAEQPFFFNENIEVWVINVPFGLFSIFGLIAAIKLYQFKK
jgi:hypothetical protein